MDQLYPASPAGAGSQLAKASPAYRRHAWLAMFALMAFIAAYLLFSGWLAWKAYQSIRASVYGAGGDGLLLMGVGLGAAFLAVFMLKALVFVRRGETGVSVDGEILPAGICGLPRRGPSSRTHVAKTAG